MTDPNIRLSLCTESGAHRTQLTSIIFSDLTPLGNENWTYNRFLADSSS